MFNWRDECRDAISRGAEENTRLQHESAKLHERDLNDVTLSHLIELTSW